jgi:hypothetical protein
MKPRRRRKRRSSLGTCTILNPGVVIRSQDATAMLNANDCMTKKHLSTKIITICKINLAPPRTVSRYIMQTIAQNCANFHGTKVEVHSPAKEEVVACSIG